MSESFADLFEESLKRSEMRTGEVITAEVVRVEHNHVVVNAGLKSEAYVPIEEFKNDKGELEVQAGDFVSVAIGSVENGYGDTILSRDTAKRLASWLAPRKPSNPATSSPAPPAARSRAASRCWSTASAPSCRVR
jgi:small subunit ribosomal protein S1